MERWLTVTQLARASTLLLGIASLAACGDSRTRPGTTDAGSDRTDAARADAATIADAGGSDAGDTDPYELGSLDETCEGVVTGRQVLAIEETYTATFEYIDGTPSTDLFLAFEYADGTILCHPAIPAPPGSGAPDRPAYLEVEVAAEISTADGAFADNVTATLTGYGPGTTELSARLDVATLAGTYEPRLMDLVSHGITFGGQIMGLSTSGSAVENGTRASGVGETIGVGSWSN